MFYFLIRLVYHFRESMLKKVSFFSLVMLIVAAIDSIRNLPAAALFGSSLIFFYLFSALIFLFPVSLISAELSSRYSEEGGIFHWVKHAFGKKWAVLAIWLQWINTMVWYPTILSFIAGTAAYLVDPQLAQNRLFLVSMILVVFWGLTLINLRGLHISAKINNYCALIGTFFPMLFLIGLGCAWILKGNPIQLSFGFRDLFPSLQNSENWVSLIAIVASYLGMELAGVHVNDVANPQKNFPRALAVSVAVLLSTMLFGALAIAVVIPEKQIRLVDGIMQTFSFFLKSFHMGPLIHVIPLLIVIGSVGGMINWLLSPAKGLLQAASDGFLPSFFVKKNQHGVAVRILFTQAILVSIFCFAFVLMPSINAFYWFLTALSTELYLFMYMLMFLAALKLGRPIRGSGAFWIPRGWRRFSCFVGLFGCLLTVVIGFFPPGGIQVGGFLRYALFIACGNLIAILPVGLLWLYEARTRNTIRKK